VDEAFATQAHQGGNAHLAGRRGTPTLTLTLTLTQTLTQTLTRTRTRTRTRTLTLTLTNAHLAGRRGSKARGADGRLLPAEPLYFPPEDVPELRRFMALHDFLGTVDPYGELPKTLA